MRGALRVFLIDRTLPPGIYVYIASVVGIGVAMLWYLTPTIPRNSASALFIFAALSMLTNILPVSLPRGGSVSTSFTANLAGVIICGPGAGAWFAAFGSVVNGAWRGLTTERVVFNVAQIAFSTGVAGIVYQRTGGQIGSARFLENVIPLICYTATYFLLNSTFVIGAIALERRMPFWGIWLMNIRWNILSYLVLAPLGFLMAYVYSTLGLYGVILFLVPLWLARLSFQQYVNMRNVYLGTVRALAAALDAKDHYTHGHSSRVAEYAAAIAREMKLPETEVERIEYTGLLHDIGKIGVSEELLNRIEELSDVEFKKIRQHTVIGASILSEITFLQGASAIIRSHHERYDGGGYPNGLSKKNIPLGARILSVADAYDAMTSDRPFRAALPVPEAVRRLKQGSGSQFDAEVVSAFLVVLEKEVVVSGAD